MSRTKDQYFDEMTANDADSEITNDQQWHIEESHAKCIADIAAADKQIGRAEMLCDIIDSERPKGIARLSPEQMAAIPCPF